jgi:hypothetical protein
MSQPAKRSLLRRLIRIVWRILSGTVMLGMAAWSSAAIYYSNLPTAWLRTLAAAAFAPGVIVLFAFVRPMWRAKLIFLAAFAGIVLWFLWIPPSNDRDWQPDVAVLPYAEISGDMVTIHNVRNCDYRSETDYTVRLYDKTFDLAKLRSVDLFVVYWGSPLIAHTMLSFGFDGGDYVCFSIETRKQKGQGYSAVKGLFRQFELTYVVGDERDLVRLRTNYRNEQVYLYRLNATPEITRLVFLDYFKTINRLKERPEWYNALTSNCTTDVHGHTYPYAKKTRWDWRILVNGYVDELVYDLRSLDQSLPFKDLKARSLIDKQAKAADKDPDFSTRIREGLPGISERATAQAMTQANAGMHVTSGASAHVGTGFAIQGPFKHLLSHRTSNDLLDVGFVRSQPSASSKRVEHRNKYVMETKYALQLTPTVKMQPDFQMVWNPAYNAKASQAAVSQPQVYLAW